MSPASERSVRGGTSRTTSVPAATKRPAGRGARVLATLEDEAPIDEDVLDPVRRSSRLVVRGVRSHRRGIEYHEVGDRIVRDASAALEPEPLGRHGGHLRNRLLEAEEALVPHELAEDPRVAAVAPRARLRADERRVRTDHRNGVLIEPPDPIGVRPGSHLVQAKVLVEQEVTQPIHELRAVLGADLAERPALTVPVVRRSE